MKTLRILAFLFLLSNVSYSQGGRVGVKIFRKGATTPETPPIASYLSGQDNLTFSSYTLDEPAYFGYVVKDTVTGIVYRHYNATPTAAGTHTFQWDGLDNSGVSVVGLPNLGYEGVAHQMQTEWLGAGYANTSTQLSNTSWTGSTRHFGYYHGPIDAIEHNGFTYYITGYSENNVTIAKFSNADPQTRIYLYKSTGTVYRDPNANHYPSIYHMATDGERIYVTARTWLGENKSWLMAFNLSDDHMYTWEGNGTSVIVNTGNHHPNGAIGVEFPAVSYTGIAVDGMYLYAAQGSVDKITVRNKLTGDVISTATFDSPHAMVWDGSHLWIATGTTLGKYSVSAGVINTTPVATISGLSDIMDLAVATVSGTTYLYVTDGGTANQLKRFNLNGSPDNTFYSGGNAFGQTGGYITNSVTADDRFHFSKIRGRNAGIWVNSDGGFWMCDAGNNRMNAYTASFAKGTTIAFEGAAYNINMVEGDSSRIFVNLLEFKIDHTSGNLQTAWQLTNNYYPSASFAGGYTPDAYGNMDASFREVVLFPNGRTYASMWVNKADGVTNSEDNKIWIVELTTAGLRPTGVIKANLLWSLMPDGSLLNKTSGGNTSELVYTRYPLTGFDDLGNPQYGSGVVVVRTPAAGEAGPNAGMAPFYTSDSVAYFFDGAAPNNGNTPYGVYNQGFKLGVVKYQTGITTAPDWLYRTIKATSPTYTGPYPTDGSMDIGNGTKYPASGGIKRIGDLLYWIHHGEFWKSGQTNMHHVLYKNGLQLMQYGVAQTNAHNNLPKGYPEMEGNVKSFLLTKVGNTIKILHGGEGYHSGVHVRNLTGSETIRTIVVPARIPN